MAPSDPLRLQVADRFVTVLNSIEAGDNYFYKPFKVAKIPIPFEDAKNGPLYMVFTGEEPGTIEFAGTDLYNETFIISVQGIIHDRTDLVSRLERAIRDIRKAINGDTKSGSAGTLGVLTDECIPPESPEIAYFSKERDDFAVFEQKYRVLINGDFGEL